MHIAARIYRRKAQSALEYAMVVICIAGALIAMQKYIKRSMQGKLRDAADQVGEQYSAQTTKSKLTQTITNPNPVTVISKTSFIKVDGEDREIMEVTRTEDTKVTVGGDSYEETGKLSDEELFYKAK